MHNAMSDRFDFQLLASAEKLDDAQKRTAKIRAANHFIVADSVQADHFQSGTIRAQSLRDSGCQYGFGLRIQH